MWFGAKEKTCWVDERGNGSAGYVLLAAFVAVSGVAGFDALGVSGREALVGRSGAERAIANQLGSRAVAASSERAGSPIDVDTAAQAATTQAQGVTTQGATIRDVAEQSVTARVTDWWSDQYARWANMAGFRDDNRLHNTVSGGVGAGMAGFWGAVQGLVTANVAAIETLVSVAATPFALGPSLS